MKLGELARNDVPLLNVCGSLDSILGKHTLAIENIYHQLGGRITVMIKEGAGHHPHSLRNPKPIADFIEQSVQPASGNRPAFADETFTKSSYYSIENSYRDSRKKGPTPPAADRCSRSATTATSSGRRASGGSRHGGHRAEDGGPGKALGVPGGLRRPGCGGRSGPAGQGFHIVTGPVSTDANGPVREQWNAVYKHLTDHGFSRKPVMEGAGTAAGEAYAWAIENPDKVSCIYGRESRPAQPHVENAAARQPGPAGQGRRAAPARLRQPRPLARRPDACGREALQGTRRARSRSSSRKARDIIRSHRRTRSRSWISS